MPVSVHVSSVALRTSTGMDGPVDRQFHSCKVAPVIVEPAGMPDRLNFSHARSMPNVPVAVVPCRNRLVVVPKFELGTPLSICASADAVSEKPLPVIAAEAVSMIGPLATGAWASTCELADATGGKTEEEITAVARRKRKA